MGTVYTAPCHLTKDIDVYSLSGENGKLVWMVTNLVDADNVRQEYKRMLYPQSGKNRTESRFHNNLRKVTAGYIHICILCM